MIKKFKIELVVLAFLLLNIFVSYNLDIGLYNFFSDLTYSIDVVYLKIFFLKITTLGASLWYFLIFVLGALGLQLYNKAKPGINKSLNKYKKFFLYGFICLLFSGILAQVCKHIVGRIRPNHTYFDSSSGFDFFSFNSNFHSFPSGHTVTIFIIALVCSRMLPGSRFYFFAFAFVVAFSRVAVGAHFFTDVVAGIAFAFIGYKIVNYYLEKKSIKLVTKDIVINQTIFSKFIVFLILASLLLTVGPTFDIFSSGLFYLGKSKFYLQSYSLITVVFREITLPIIGVYVLILPVLSMFLPIKKLFFNYTFSIKEIIYIWLAFVGSLGIFINLVLKTFWGRARPNDILQLGGKESFSPWYKYSDACVSNCSFVSGDAAVGFSLVILYLVTNNIKYAYFSIFFGISIGLVRIVEGGHFLSDIVFSGLVVFLLSFFIKKLFLHNAHS